MTDTPPTLRTARRPLRGIALVAGLAILAVGAATGPPGGWNPAAYRVAVVGIVMAGWWMTEAIPIPATALLPLVAFPLYGIATAREAAAPYGNPLVFLFLGGFLIAAALERHGLHRRIALHVLGRVGTRPARIVAGFMAASAALSMWISNTATAMMMLPIALSILTLARAGRDRDEPTERFATALLLGVAYACSIGGVVTLIGTPTNALLAGFALENLDVRIGFVEWMVDLLPLAVVGLVLTFLYLTRIAHPTGLERIAGGDAFVRDALERLGRAGRAERRVAAVFGITVLAWLSRRALEAVVPGIDDTAIAVSGALALFAVPAGDGRGRLLGWEDTRRVPWGVLLLFGGGLSLASAVDATGLADRIGRALGVLDGVPLPLVVIAVVAVIVFLTELTSNTATAAAFLPVLASMATALGHDPLTLAVPAVIAASCAFMLPVATPPNAIVFGSGEVPIARMAKTGLALNVLFVGWVSVWAVFVR